MKPTCICDDFACYRLENEEEILGRDIYRHDGEFVRRTRETIHECLANQAKSVRIGSRGYELTKIPDMTASERANLTPIERVNLGLDTHFDD